MMRSKDGTARFWIRTVLLLAAFEAAHTGIELLGSMLIPGDVYRGALAGDIVLALAVAPLLWRSARRGPGWEPESDGRLSVFGLCVLAGILVFMYAAVEMAGLWIGYLTPTAGETAAYQEMSDETLYLYIIRAVTAGPFLEEIASRYLIFRPVRARYGFWPACVLSALYFTSIHGTLMHVPLTIALTLFVCTLYGVTGKFRCCVAVHMAFNWLSTTLIFSIEGFPVWARFLCLGLSYLSLICLYAFRKQLFGRVLNVGAMDAFEAFLNRELDRMADEAEATGEGAARDGQDDDSGSEERSGSE